MIRLYEDEATSLDVPSIYGGDFHKDVKLYDVVKCCGYEWYVIKIEDDVVTLLAKNDDFDNCEFDSDNNDYEFSDIRKYLKYGVLPELQKANPIPTDLPDVRCTDKVWLLSVNEAEKLPTDVLKFDKRWWWLRTRGAYDDLATDVRSNGSLNTYGSGVDIDEARVRPAMRVRVEDLD